MIRYSIQPIYFNKHICKKLFLAFARSMGKDISKNNLLQIHLKLIQKERSKNCRGNWWFNWK